MPVVSPRRCPRRSCRRPGRRPAGVFPVAVLAAAAMTSGCAGTAAAHSTPPAAACRALPAAVLPHAAGSLSQADTGTYCLSLGRQVDVFLTAPGDHPAQSARWSPVTSSSPNVLTATSSGVLTAPMGVTPGIFVGTARGTAVVASRLPGGRTWRAVVVVR